MRIVFVYDNRCQVGFSFSFTRNQTADWLKLFFSAEVAKHLEDDSFGLIFGINTLVAVLLQTVLTLAVVSETGLALTVFQQYTVYAVYFYVLAAIYLVAFVYSLLNSLRMKSTKDTSIDVTNETHSN